MSLTEGPGRQGWRPSSLQSHDVFVSLPFKLLTFTLETKAGMHFHVDHNVQHLFAEEQVGPVVRRRGVAWFLGFHIKGKTVA